MEQIITFDLWPQQSCEGHNRTCDYTFQLETVRKLLARSVATEIQLFNSNNLTWKEMILQSTTQQKTEHS